MSQTETTNNLHEKVCEPHDRHIYSKINQKTKVKDRNTVIEPGVDYKKDIEDIKQGKAKYDAKNRQFEVNGRTYQIHDKARKNGDYRSYPIGGKGTHQLDRGEFKAFKTYKTHSNNPQLLKKRISNQEKSYVKSSSQKRDAAERFEKDLKRGRDVWEICQAKEKAINQANQAKEKLNSEDYCKENKDAAKSIAKNTYEADQRNPKELAQETARRSAKGGKTEMGIFKDVNRAHPDYVNNNLKDARKIARDAHQAHNKNKTPSEKGKGEDKGKNTQGHNQKEEVGNKVKGNNSNSSNSSPSSSKNAKSSASQGDTNKNAGSKPPPQPNRGRGH